MSQPRSGRIFQYPQEVPYDIDLLWTNAYRMVDISNLARTILGTGPAVNYGLLGNGLVATQHVVPNLSVDIGPGVMYAIANYDTTAYSSVPPDTTDQLYKQFTFFGVSQFGLGEFVAPGSGTNNYLIQAINNTNDSYATARQFYNADDPADPFVYTNPYVRNDTVILSWKVATYPSVPSPDPGNIGLYVVAVPSGATTILNSNISVYPGAPVVTEGLQDKISQATGDSRYVKNTALQSATPIYGNDSGAANTYVVTATPAYASLVAGSFVFMLAAHTNTGASTLNISSLSGYAIKKNTPLGLIPLSGGEIVAGSIYKLQYDGSVFQLENPSVPSSCGLTIYPDSGQTVASGVSQLITLDNSTLKSDETGTVTYSDTPNYSFTANLTGRYAIAATIDAITSAAATGNFVLLLTGAISQKLDQSIVAISGAEEESLVGYTEVQLSAGNVIQFLFHNTTGVTVTLSPTGTFSMRFLGK